MTPTELAAVVQAIAPVIRDYGRTCELRGGSGPEQAASLRSDPALADLRAQVLESAHPGPPAIIPGRR
jgi:hypothetical protein